MVPSMPQPEGFKTNYKAKARSSHLQFHKYIQDTLKSNMQLWYC